MIHTQIIHGEFKQFRYEGWGTFYELVESKTGKIIHDLDQMLEDFKDKKCRIKIEVEG